MRRGERRDGIREERGEEGPDVDKSILAHALGKIAQARQLIRRERHRNIVDAVHCNCVTKQRNIQQKVA